MLRKRPEVKQGDLLINFHLQTICNHASSDITPIIVTQGALQTLILNKVNMATFHLAINYLKLDKCYATASAYTFIR